MTNLTIGQRIDVYEIIGYRTEMPEGLQTLGHDGDDMGPCIMNTNGSELWVMPHEVKKCGYYLKVKSMKGVSNA